MTVSILTRLKGASLLTAGALAGILGPGRRFQREAHLAAYAGGAPLGSLLGRPRAPSPQRHPLAYGYRMALTQLRCWPPAQECVARRLSEGKTKREAIRALKRYLVRAIWRVWQACVSHQASSSFVQAA